MVAHKEMYQSSPKSSGKRSHKSRSQAKTGVPGKPRHKESSPLNYGTSRRSRQTQAQGLIVYETKDRAVFPRNLRRKQ